MGDPKHPKKKYSRPFKIWQKERILEEADLMKEYGIKNKKELWKFDTSLKNFKGQAKKLIASKTVQAEKEKILFITKLNSFGFLKANAVLEDVLDLSLKDLLERRLQTLILRKGLAKTIKQARQFITHNHISLGGRAINVPSAMISIKDESLIGFSQKSDLVNPDHAERAVVKRPEQKKRKEQEKGRDKWGSKPGKNRGGDRGRKPREGAQRRAPKREESANKPGQK